MKKLPRIANPRRSFRPLRLEPLEERVVLDAAVIEDFSAGLAPYTTVLRFTPNAAVIPGAGHDGVANALLKGDGYEWLVRNDLAVTVQPGETISAWIDLAANADGRAYLGFAAQPNAVNNYLRTGGALSLVLAPNSDQLLLENNSGFTHTALAAVPMTYSADHWYRAEVVWGDGGALTGNLYDSDGVTLLTSVSGTTTTVPGSGIAFRAFGSDKYFDTITEDDGSAGPAGRVHGAAVDPGARPAHRLDQNLPPGGLLDPFEYQSVPGTGRDIWLGEFDQLAQYGIVNGVVGLAATNRSENHGNPNSYWGEMGWGPVVQGLDDPSETPIQTPLLQQYIFRQLPGEATTLIGRSDVKHFFLATGVDGQQLRPGEQDTYGSSLNADQDFYSPQADVNPVTGEISNQALDYFGKTGGTAPRNLDGLNQFSQPNYSSRIDHLLQVNVADLDPSQNPPGTRWFLAGNIFVPGDEDVTHTSRWVEITPSFSGSTFRFTYPNGSGGQYNIRTMPGLTGIPPVVIAQTPTGTQTGPIHIVTITFSQPIDPSTFTPDKITSFTGPNGAIRVNRVTPVPGSNDTQFRIHFRRQFAGGTYAMTIGPDIADQEGNLMASPFRATFAILSPSVIAQTPTGNTVAPVDTVQVTFNEPIDPATFTPDQVTSFTGPAGAIAVDDVTPADDSDTRFLIHFTAQVTIGQYTMTIGPDIEDFNGAAMASAFQARFTIVGPRVANLVRNGAATEPPTSVRVTFNEPMSEADFTPDKVTDFTDPNGNPITVNSITPVDGSNDTQFDIGFDPQNTLGTYSITLSADILDQYGNPLPGPYTGTFVFTDDSIVNGGFETGDFTGWTQSGNTTSTSVSTTQPHTGRYAAQLGPSGSLGFLSQTVTTTPGNSYVLTYWLAHPNGGTPNEFQVSIGGTIVYDQTNLGNFAYTEFTFTYTATAATTQITFGFREDPAYFYFDDVSFTSAPMTGANGGNGLFSAPAPANPVANSTPVTAVAVGLTSSGTTASGTLPQKPAVGPTDPASAPVIVGLSSSAVPVAGGMQPMAAAASSESDTLALVLNDRDWLTTWAAPI